MVWRAKSESSNNVSYLPGKKEKKIWYIVCVRSKKETNLELRSPWHGHFKVQYRDQYLYMYLHILNSQHESKKKCSIIPNNKTNKTEDC